MQHGKISLIHGYYLGDNSPVSFLCAITRHSWRRKMKIALFAAVASLAAGATYAGGYVAPVATVEPVVVAPTASVSDWNGFYTGANVNWGKGKLKAAGDAADFLSDEGLSRTLSKPDGVS